MTEEDEEEGLRPVYKKVKTTGDEPKSDDVDENLSSYELAKQNKEEKLSTQESLYLETIDRRRLDFDFEKLCSISLSNNNVYACLTCGVYFQGRGKRSYAYLHSVDSDHHVFINLQTLKIYVLPEGYEVQSAVLDDIKYVIDPYYTKEYVQSLDTTPHDAFDLSRRTYSPGYIGINNIKANDYSNVIIQLLVHIPPIRNYFMLNNTSSSSDNTNELVQRFGILTRKIWNPKAFKPHVSPHELLQYISAHSQKKFTPIKQEDPFAFMNWFLNQLHLGLGGSKTKPKSSLIQKNFQGKLQIETQKTNQKEAQFEVTKTRFLFLTLDLPPAPLFKESEEGNAIPQIALTEVLKKYDGDTIQELAGERKRYKILELPQFLILVIKRFPKIGTITDRNPTIVSFNPVGLDMSPFLSESQDNNGTKIEYDLVGNVVYESDRADNESTERHLWKVQILDRSRDKWLEIQDLIVEQVRRELLFLSESYIQIWEKRKA